MSVWVHITAIIKTYNNTIITILYNLWIMPQILLEPHQQHRYSGAEVLDLLDPALRDVLQAVRARDGEAEQQYVRVGVREGPQSTNITSIRQLSSPSPNISHQPIQFNPDVYLSLIFLFLY